MYNRKGILFLFMLIAFGLSFKSVHAQQPTLTLPGANQSQVTYDNQGRPIKRQKDSLTLKHRDQFEDSITINFKYFDSSRIHRLDSSISDFRSKYPLPYTYNDLGNYGTAGYSLLFKPYMKPGWDPGFHAFDIYQFTLEGTRFFQTTRPYTELAYLLGSKSEQMINLLHTQNRQSNFNFAFEYRFLNTPGTYRSQNTSHNNIRFNSFYQTSNKRYGIYFIFISNNLKSSENGGVVDEKKLDSLQLGDPYELQTRIGNGNGNSRNFFNTNIVTGTQYKNNTIFFRHYYDLGKKDSLVTDSITYKLFYPRLRLQHTFSYTNSQYIFQDYLPVPASYVAFFNYYNASDSVRFKDTWKNMTNELSILTFPEKNNLNQFLKLGIVFQSLKGQFDTIRDASLSNIYVTGEYRNRTRNQKWDVLANAQLYVGGNYIGDYSAYISLSRSLGKRVGTLEAGFQNVNRTPSYIYDNPTSFPVVMQGSFNKENTTRIFANLYLPTLQLKLTGNYYIVSNYSYFNNFFEPAQESTLFNVLQLGGEKKFRLSRLFNWYTELYLQQPAGNPPVNLPNILTRNRIALEGNFYKNLFLSTGFEVRYYTPFKPATYSPFVGQFFYQNDYKTANRPDIDVYLNFRIKSFKAFVRLENLNTLNLQGTNVGFTHPNFSGDHYPGRGLWFRFGFWWSFVN